MDKLKKQCPFCGELEGLRVLKIIGCDKKTLIGWRVVCDLGSEDCGCEGPIRDTRKAAIRAWGIRCRQTTKRG